MNKIFVSPNNIPKGVIIAESKRFGGVSAGAYENLNTALHVGDIKEDVIENRKIFFGKLGIDFKKSVFLNQVHSNHVHKVIEEDIGKGAFDEKNAITADAVITNIRGAPIVIQTADCLSVVLYSPSSKSIGNIHAGWPGLSGGIIENTINKMEKYFHADTKDIYAYLGVRIGRDDFEVGEDVAEKFSFPLMKDGKFYIDLAFEAKAVLYKHGVKDENIFDSKLTSFESDFFSYRRDKKVTGRMATVVMLE